MLAVMSKPKPGSLLRRSDRFLHEPRYRDWNWVETNWFCFYVPELAMCGHLRALFKPTLKIVESNVFSYSRQGLPASTVLAMDLHDERHGMTMPTDNLDAYTLENGMKVRQTVAFQEWEVRYEDRDGNVVDLHLKALMPPVEVSETKVEQSGEGFGSIQRTDPNLVTHGHIDQMLDVKGEVRIQGQRHAVDFPAPRDHSWGPRRESVKMGCGNFDDGHIGDFHFLFQTRNDTLERSEVTHGYLLDGGEVLRLVRGEGRYSLDGYRTTGLEYEVEDERGRTHLIRGEPEAIVEKVATNSYSVNGATRWHYGGESGFGEYRWHWGVSELREWLAGQGKAPPRPTE
jgi:hypothetical protein